MTNSKGYRRNSRHVFSRPHKKHGFIINLLLGTEHLSTYLHTYKRGQFVDIKGHGAFHKGMPHLYFHGKTAKVFDVTKRALGVIVNKRVKGRIVQKRMHVRIEHVHPSRCAEDHIMRVQKRKELVRNKKAGEVVPSVKRQPMGPRKGHFVRCEKSKIVELKPIKFTNMF